MAELKFETTLKCSGCIQKITPDFNGEKGIKSWNVDLSTNPKILTVEADSSITPEKVEALLAKEGYKGKLIAK